MQTNFYIPHQSSLKEHIQSIWQIDRFTPHATEHIIPKGVVEIIFNFSDGQPIVAGVGNKQYHLTRCFINGFNSKPLRLQLPRRQIFFGITIQPLAAKKIFRTPAVEFADHLVDLTLIDKNFDSLWHQLAACRDFNERVARITNWFQTISFEWSPQEMLMNDFLISPMNSDVTVHKLSGSLCYSSRHLSRKLFEVSGMNTEELLLYKRFLHAVHLMHHTELSLTQIAYNAHFSDQSHFIKSFKGYSEMTPGEYRRNKGHVKGHIYFNELGNDKINNGWASDDRRALPRSEMEIGKEEYMFC